VIYHVETGDLDCVINASSHKQAAMHAIKDSNKDLGVLVVVKEGHVAERAAAENIYFLTQNILDELDQFSMRLVG